MEIAGFFGEAGFVQELNAGGGAERGPVADGPDDFFVGSDLDNLNDGEAIGARAAAITEHSVAVGEAIGGLDDAQFDAGQIVFLDGPDNFAFRI